MWTKSTRKEAGRSRIRVLQRAVQLTLEEQRLVRNRWARTGETFADMCRRHGLDAALADERAIVARNGWLVGST